MRKQMPKANSQRVTALFHKMLDAVLNNETGFYELVLVGDNHSKQCEFTLVQLFECFVALDDELVKLSYTEFRKILFNSPINQEMKKRGGKIDILDNKQKVDESVYCLKVKP
ncbi:MAG: hypothetical protein V7785_08955 [Bermanella sp.]